jgi:HCOMODA/2-hydroxy-3-carboxy-muconic semialdehyde decarboxylase
MGANLHQDRRQVMLALAAAAIPVSAWSAEPDARFAAVIDDLVLANHILADQGVVDAFGHVSARHPQNPQRFLLSRNLSPAQVTPADIMEYGLDGEPINPAGRSSYLERYIHAAVYRARPDVGAVVHSHSPGVIPFSISKTPLRPVYHMAGFLVGGVRVFDIQEQFGPATDMLIRDSAMGAALARALGDSTVVLMRGHGAVAVGATVRLAVMHAVYTEMNARLQGEAIRLGRVTYLTDQEAISAWRTIDSQVERAWGNWTSRLGDRGG